MNNWLEFYKKNYKPLLDIQTNFKKRGVINTLFQRASGFQKIFELLLAQKENNFKIIETGTLRKVDNWKDGQSARLFTEFVRVVGGSVRSVDIDPEACKEAHNFLQHPEFTVTCSDSLNYLSSLTDLTDIDLFYLDSYDVKWDNDTPSAEHHLKEFKIIEPFLKPGCIVAIDDNTRLLSNNNRVGKGRRIVEYLESTGKTPLYDNYQIIYQF